MTKLLRIEWEGPLSYEDVLRTKGDNSKDYGLYQIYTHHLVFGPRALVYIGKAQEQTFAARLSQHGYWLSGENDAGIRLGRLAEGDYRQDDGWEEWKLLLTEAEMLSVYWHSPPYNSHYITEYRGRELRIQNWGNRGSLLPEYSSHWRPLRPDDTAPE